METLNSEDKSSNNYATEIIKTYATIPHLMSDILFRLGRLICSLLFSVMNNFRGITHVWYHQWHHEYYTPLNSQQPTDNL